MALDQAGHAVVIIDKDKRAFQKRLPERWTGRAVLGYGFDRDHLEQAGIAEADALAAVTSGDNTNILSARIARETYEIPNVVARIYDPRRAVIYQRLGIPTVASVSWTVDQVIRKLVPDQLASEWTDASGELALIERVLPGSWAGRRLTDLDQGTMFRVVALSRGGAAQLPTSDLLGQEGDVIHVAVRKEAIDSLASRLATDPAAAGHH